MVEGRALTGVRIRSALSVGLFAIGLISLLVSAMYIHHVLVAYPVNDIARYGPAVPALGGAYAAWLRYAPSGLALASVASIIVLLVARRALVSPEARTFAAALIAAVDLFLALFCAMALLLAYFSLPKLADGF